MENELEIKIDDEFAKKVYDEIWAEYKKTAQTKTFAKITLTEDELEITDSKVMGLPYVPIGKKFQKRPMEMRCFWLHRLIVKI